KLRGRRGDARAPRQEARRRALRGAADAGAVRDRRRGREAPRGRAAADGRGRGREDGPGAAPARRARAARAAAADALAVIRRVAIEKLAPTGEGVARTAEGVGFVEGALPGEEVEAEVVAERKRFWFGRAAAIVSPSPARSTGPHAGCAGCDWSHLQGAAALEAKPVLFRETMERIGGLAPA